MVMKVEDFQNFGKEQYEAALASVSSFTKGYQAIATAYADYSKKSFEDTSAFVEKLSGVKSIEKAVELQTEFTKSAYETFVAESKKISELYAGLAKDAYKPFEGYVSKFAPTATTSH
jgi:phasin family protein